MIERRTDARFAPAAVLAVRDADTGEGLGRLVDISVRGLLVFSETPLPLHRRYRLRVPVPGESPGAEVELSAEAAWSVCALDPPGHRTGFRGLEAGRGQQALLDRLIELCDAAIGS